MTNPEAANAIYGIIQMMLTIGLPLCMVAGWRDTGAKRKTNKQTTRRAKRGRRPAGKANDLVNVRRKAKAEKARPLSKPWYVAPPFSDAEQREYDGYYIKRQFV